MSQLAVSTANGEKKQVSKWLVLIALTLAFTYTFISRYIWGTVSPIVSKEFGLSATQAGLYMSAFFAGYVITQVPGGIMADKLQPKFILIACTLLGGISTAMMSFIPGYQVGLILRIITGVSSGCIMSCCSKVVAIVFSMEMRASAMGILLASPPIGILLANFLGTPINNALGWRKTFLVVGLFSIVVAIFILLVVPMIPKAENTGKKTGLLEGIKAFVKNKDQIILGLSGFMFMFVNVGFATWNNSYMGTMNFTPQQGGMVITVYSIAGILASCFSGTITRVLKIWHKKFLIITLSLMVVITLVYMRQTTYMGLLIVGFIYGAVSYLPSTHYTTIAIQKAGNEYAATASSTQNLMFQAASMIQPAIVGAVIDATGNYNFVWYIFAACAVLAVLFVTRVNTNELTH